MQVLAYFAVLIQGSIQLQAKSVNERPLARILRTRVLPSGRVEVTVPFEDTFLYNGVRLARVRPYPCQQRLRGIMGQRYINMGYCMPSVKFERSGESTTTEGPTTASTETTTAETTTAETTTAETTTAETTTAGTTTTGTTTEQPTTATVSSRSTNGRSTTQMETTTTEAPTTEAPTTEATTTEAPTTEAPTTTMATTNATTMETTNATTMETTNATTMETTNATANTIETTNTTSMTTDITNATATTETTANLTTSATVYSTTTAGPTTLVPIVATSQATVSFTTVATPVGLQAARKKVRAPKGIKSAALEQDEFENTSLFISTPEPMTTTTQNIQILSPEEEAVRSLSGRHDEGRLLEIKSRSKKSRQESPTSENSDPTTTPMTDTEKHASKEHRKIQGKDSRRTLHPRSKKNHGSSSRQKHRGNSPKSRKAPGKSRRKGSSSSSSEETSVTQTERRGAQLSTRGFSTNSFSSGDGYQLLPSAMGANQPMSNYGAYFPPPLAQPIPNSNYGNTL